ncbi:MAG: hypothetical protein QM621_14435 [Aeromicrobium sp.]|uniref:hypothetical protein n=1 Tax=Aeromicrobium sp. TaxID=1871063 RepID=UPI0039E2B217
MVNAPPAGDPGSERLKRQTAICAALPHLPKSAVRDILIEQFGISPDKDTITAVLELSYEQLGDVLAAIIGRLICENEGIPDGLAPVIDGLLPFNDSENDDSHDLQPRLEVVSDSRDVPRLWAQSSREWLSQTEFWGIGTRDDGGIYRGTRSG